MYKVLVVDDDAVVLGTLRDIFATREFEVTTAASAAKAIETVAAQAFDLVVTDMRMETDTAGFEVVHAAKSQSYPPAVAILSAFPIPATEWRGGGADAFFMKGGGIFRMLDDLEALARINRAKRPISEGLPEKRKRQAG